MRLEKQPAHRTKSSPHASLEKKHDVPCSSSYDARIILRPAHENKRRSISRRSYRTECLVVHMKSLALYATCARPTIVSAKIDFARLLIAADKSSPKTPRCRCDEFFVEKFQHPGIQRALSWPRSVCHCQFAAGMLNTRLGAAKSQFVIARSQCISCRLVHTQPKFVCSIHVGLSKAFTCLARISAFARKICIVIRIAIQDASPTLAHNRFALASTLSGCASCQ